MSDSLRTLVLATLAAIGLLGNAQAETIKDVTHIHGIEADPADPNKAYLATHRGLFSVNTDGVITRISKRKDDFMGFVVDPTQPNVMYASGHPPTGGNIGLIKSEDGGKSWKHVSNGVRGPVDYHALTISASDPNVLYGLYGSIQHSRDGGKTWKITGKPPAQTYDIAVSSKNPDVLYAATKSGLFMSKDSGSSWSAAHLVRKPATLVEVLADGRVMAFMDGFGLIQTNEPSMAWKPVWKGDKGIYLRHLAASPTQSEVLYASDTKKRLLRSGDGGKTWKSLPK